MPKPTRSPKVPPRATLRPANVRVVIARDLHNLSQKFGMDIVFGEKIEAMTYEINDALYEACHTAMIEESQTYAVRAAWCVAIARRSDDLAQSIFSATPNDGWVPWDALRILGFGGPGGPVAPEAETKAKLTELMIVASPGRSERSFDDQIIGTLGQVAPSLQALSLLANSAAVHWQGKTRRGGKSPERARHHLMKRLLAIYEQFFDLPLTVSVREQTQGRSHRPQGTGLDWLRGLFELVVQCLPSEEGAEPLRVIATNALEKTDALANWVTEARRQRKSKGE